MDRIPEIREGVAYKVYWEDHTGERHMDDVVANDHECARIQIDTKLECVEVLLVMKGDPLILWQA